MVDKGEGGGESLAWMAQWTARRVWLCQARARAWSGGEVEGRRGGPAAVGRRRLWGYGGEGEVVVGGDGGVGAGGWRTGSEGSGGGVGVEGRLRGSR